RPEPKPRGRWSHGCAHFGRLLELSQPAEFSHHVVSLRDLVLRDGIPVILRNPLVRAAVAYAHNEGAVRFWEDYLEGTMIPGQAFEALLQIDPHHPRVESALVSLWCRSLRGEIRLNTPLYEFARLQSEPEVAIQRVLRKIVEAAPD